MANPSNAARSSKLRVCAGIVALLSLPACNVNQFAANQTVKVIEAGSKGGSAFWDYEAAGLAMPGAMVQGEMLLRVTPQNEDLLLGLTRTYVSYAYGWLQFEWEKADLAGDFETADHLAKRIRNFYLRAYKLSRYALSLRDEGGQLDAVLDSRDAKRMRAYVKANFDDVDDVPALYWFALSWGSVMASPVSSVDEVADAPMAVALVDRVIELDPDYEDGGAYGLLGAVEAAFPELFGGDLAKARDYYEKAIAAADRKDHLTLVGFARSYAVAAQDRQLFLDLLHEVIEAPDQGDAYRLVNKVARVRAELYLQHVNNWFLPPAP